MFCLGQPFLIEVTKMANQPTTFNDNDAVRGIDVSHHNGIINWQKVHAAGIAFAFTKATEGAGLIAVFRCVRRVSSPRVSKGCRGRVPSLAEAALPYGRATDTRSHPSENRYMRSAQPVSGFVKRASGNFDKPAIILITSAASSLSNIGCPDDLPA